MAEGTPPWASPGPAPEGGGGGGRRTPAERRGPGDERGGPPARTLCPPRPLCTAPTRGRRGACGGASPGRLWGRVTEAGGGGAQRCPSRTLRRGRGGGHGGMATAVAGGDGDLGIPSPPPLPTTSEARTVTMCVGGGAGGPGGRGVGPSPSPWPLARCGAVHPHSPAAVALPLRGPRGGGGLRPAMPIAPPPLVPPAPPPQPLPCASGRPRTVPVPLLCAAATRRRAAAPPVGHVRPGAHSPATGAQARVPTKKGACEAKGKEHDLQRHVAGAVGHEPKRRRPTAPPPPPPPPGPMRDLGHLRCRGASRDRESSIISAPPPRPRRSPQSPPGLRHSPTAASEPRAVGALPSPPRSPPGARPQRGEGRGSRGRWVCRPTGCMWGGGGTRHATSVWQGNWVSAAIGPASTATQ